MTRPLRSIIAFCMLVGSISAFSGSNVSAEPRPIHEDILPVSLETLASEVLVGNYGNGDDRKDMLSEEGLTDEQVEAVQEIVNKNLPKVTRTDLAGLVRGAMGKRPPTLPSGAPVPTQEPAPSHPGVTGSVANWTPPKTTTTTTTPPPAPGWNGRIPSYRSGGACEKWKADSIARSMWNVGASNAAVERMLLIVSRESNCNSGAYNGNRGTGDDSWGICQLNALAGFFSSNGILRSFNRFAFASNFAHNADACAKLYSVCGFGPWTKPTYGCRRP